MSGDILDKVFPLPDDSIKRTGGLPKGMSLVEAVKPCSGNIVGVYLPDPDLLQTETTENE